jgi:hypothetical protein
MNSNSVGFMVRRSPPRVSTGKTKHLVMPDLPVGVEIELLNVSLVRELVGWRVITDGSLRGEGGRELVCRRPYNGTSLLKALTMAESALAQTEPIISNDTSLHIHLDVSRLDKATLVNVVNAFVIFEGVLMEAFCTDRQENPFCQQMRHNHNLLTSLARYLASDFSSMIPRYAATNAASISRFGSLEFRGHPAVTTKAEILEWINALMCVYQYALESSVSPHIRMKGLSGYDVMRGVFGDRIDLAAVTPSLFDEGCRVGRELAFRYKGLAGTYPTDRWEPLFNQPSVWNQPL